MAHFALVNSDGIVETVQVINNNVLDANGDFPDSEASGQAFQHSLGLSREDALWLQTSYNTFGGVHYTSDEEGNREPSEDQSKSYRKNYAGIGYIYDEERDAFIPPKPEDGEWVLDEDTCLWVEVTDETE
jgi:hypothetical protein